MVSWRLVTMSFLPSIWLFFSLSFARGNYTEFLHRWRWPLGIALLAPVSLAFVFRNEWFVFQPPAKPGDSGMLSLGAAGFLLNLFFLIGTVLVLMNLERTYRAAVGTIRWRIKFMVVGLVVIFAARTYTSSQALLFHAVNLSLQIVDSVALVVGCLLIVRSLLRVGHFEMPVYPSHAVLHNSLTVLPTGIYLVIVGVFVKFVAWIGGGRRLHAQNLCHSGGVGGVDDAAAAVRPREVAHQEYFVSRHFQRPLYDYRTVWRRFTEGTASCVTQAELSNAAVKLVTDIFQVLSVSIWLVDEKKKSCCLPHPLYYPRLGAIR